MPAGVVQNIADRMEHDPQLQYRGFYPIADHPQLGPHRFEGVPVQMSRSRWEVRRGAPEMGEHQDYVFRELLGLSDDEIAELALEAVF